MGKFVDVNKENYMKALFLDVQKQSKMVEFPDSAKLIHDFVMNNPTNSDSSKITSNGVELRNGRIVIHARKRK
jgi:hypothetical protein